MLDLLGPGNQQDGLLHITSNVTDTSIIDSTATGSGTSIAASNASFAAGQRIFIHQTQGVGHGQCEVAQIQSYDNTHGVITTVNPLLNTYIAGAQVIVVRQFSQILFDSACFLTIKSWNGSTGGFFPFCCAGAVSCPTADGGFNTVGCGFQGGAASINGAANQGESFIAGVSGIAAANNSGGGGTPSPAIASGPGAGAGYVTTGGNGVGGSNSSQGGAICGNAALTIIELSSAGGGSTDALSAAAGTNGSGVVIGFCSSWVTTMLVCDAPTPNVSLNASAGSGAAGTGFIRAVSATLGNNLITARGKQPGASAIGWIGGGGSDGRFHFEICSITDIATYSTYPPLDLVNGGLPFCFVPGQII